MEEYEITNENNFHGLRNFIVPVPGTNVRAYLGVFDRKPEEWNYSLWTGEGDIDLISTGTLDLSGLDANAQQVARIAYLLDVEYGDNPIAHGSM